MGSSRISSEVESSPNRRDEILDVATELFAANGFSDTVTQLLADRLEVGKGTIDCIWQLIYDRLKNLGQLHRLENPKLYKDWSTSRDAGPRTMIREELRK